MSTFVFASPPGRAAGMVYTRRQSPQGTTKIVGGFPYTRPRGGAGYLAGTYPDGLTKLEGVPTSMTVRAVLRAAAGEVGDGVLVAQTTSAADGTWLIPNLDPTLKYDVVCRYPGYNDTMWANVTPKV